MIFFRFLNPSCMFSADFLRLFHISHSIFPVSHRDFPVSHFAFPVSHPTFPPLLLACFFPLHRYFFSTHCMISLHTHYLCILFKSWFLWLLFHLRYYYLFILCFYELFLWLKAFIIFSEFILHLFMIYFAFIWISRLFLASSCLLVFFRIFCN